MTNYYDKLTIEDIMLTLNTYSHQLIRWLIARNFIPSDESIKILDIGTGDGCFYFALKDEGYNNIFAIDKKSQFKECISADITKKLPYKSNSFDLIISRDLIEHIAEQDKFFQEQYRILKRGGIIIIMTPDAQYMTLGKFYDDYTHLVPYTRKSLAEGMRINGFKCIQTMKLRAIPLMWHFTIKAFDYLFSGRKCNILAIGVKK